MDIHNYFDFAKEDADLNTIKEALEKYNIAFFNLLKEVLTFNQQRSIDINTFLLNFYIGFNYFPSVKQITTLLMDQKDQISNIATNYIIRSTKNYERIHGIFILINLLYKNAEYLTNGETDKKINNLYSIKGVLSERFFLYNLNPPTLLLKDLFKIIDEYKGIDNLLPELLFDPEFEKVLRSPPIRQIFFTTTPLNFLNLRDKIPYDYYPEEYLINEDKNCDPNKLYFKIDNKLQISQFLREENLFLGLAPLGPIKLIDDVVIELTKYYSFRILSQKEYIQNSLLCFRELLKLAEGKLFKKITRQKIIDKLGHKVSLSFANDFMNKVCLEAQHRDFDLDFNNFKASSFLSFYQDFLRYACFYTLGNVRTGVFLIWRAMIKFLEDLQKEEEFRKMKGQLLEIWCFNQAKLRGLSVQKLILINPHRKPTEKYYEMKKEIANFPKEPIEIKANFETLNPNAYYREIDLAIRFKNTLFLFECKGTSAPIGEINRTYNWVENFLENLELLNEKKRLLEDNIKAQYITNDFTDGVDNFQTYIIKTEGIDANYNLMDIYNYIKFLDELKQKNNSDLK